MSALHDSFKNYMEEFELAMHIGKLRGRRYILKAYQEIMKNEEIKAQLEKPNISIIPPEETRFSILVKGCSVFDRISIISPSDRQIGGRISIEDGTITGLREIYEMAILKNEEFVTSTELGYEEDIKTFYTIEEVIEEIKNLFKII